MEENGGNTMKQNLFCVESCSQGLWVELSRFPSETNSTVLVSFFFFSSSFLQLISFFILLYCLYYYIIIFCKKFNII